MQASKDFEIFILSCREGPIKRSIYGTMKVNDAEKAMNLMSLYSAFYVISFANLYQAHLAYMNKIEDSKILI